MSVETDEATRRVERRSQGLSGAGLHLTHQRLEVVRTIAAEETHPDVETVYRAVRERVPTIPLGTAYRTLATLTERGLIARALFTFGLSEQGGDHGMTGAPRARSAAIPLPGEERPTCPTRA